MATVKTNEEVAANIRDNADRLLDEKGWSQRRLSRETGDPHMSVVNALSGDHVPNSGILARIAEALGVTADELIDSPPKPRKKTRKTA
jgi:transcriptional regulator with XRE-family HTH domain